MNATRVGSMKIRNPIIAPPASTMIEIAKYAASPSIKSLFFEFRSGLFNRVSDKFFHAFFLSFDVEKSVENSSRARYYFEQVLRVVVVEMLAP